MNLTVTEPRPPMDRRYYRLADSVEDFLRSLHCEDTATIPTR